MGPDTFPKSAAHFETRRLFWKGKIKYDIGLDSKFALVLGKFPLFSV